MEKTIATASPAACIYCCPRCRHRIRFRWRSFYQADGRSAFKRQLRRFFDDMTPTLSTEEQGILDFYCPTCSAPTRIIYSADDYSKIAYHFDIYAALVGAGKPAQMKNVFATLHDYDPGMLPALAEFWRVDGKSLTDDELIRQLQGAMLDAEITEAAWDRLDEPARPPCSCWSAARRAA